MMKIGVTGHINLKKSCIQYYKNQLFKKLKYLKKKNTDIVVYSALANGSDRLVVEIAKQLSISYIAVLPMEKEIYKSDFDEVSTIEFENLLQLSVDVIVMPEYSNYLKLLKPTNEQKELQYEAAGRYISDISDTVIALWDGKYNNFKGGTSETVKYYISKKNYTLHHLLVSRSDDLTNNMINFRTLKSQREIMDINEVIKMLEKYNVKSLDELEYYLDVDGGNDECIDDEKVALEKYCTKRQCYEDSFVPDCRKIIEIYSKYFKDDIKSKRLFIEYLVQHTERKSSSIENYMSCKSCNQQVQKSISSSLKISDSDFKKDFCNNLSKKFSYVSLFGNDYISIKQFLNKEHQVTKDSFEPIFANKEVTMTKEEENKLFDLTHVSKDQLKANLENLENVSGSYDYKMNLALAAFDRNLIEESYRLIEILSNEEELNSNIKFLQLKAKILSSKNMDIEAIEILEKLVLIIKPDINAETNSLLAASIKRNAFREYEIYADEYVLIEELSRAKNIYFSVYQLNSDYYPALNYMYLSSMLSYLLNDSAMQVGEKHKEYKDIWKNVDHKIIDWWSFIADIEYLVILEDYKLAEENLKLHFEGLEDIEISDFNISSTVRQLKLYANFCNNPALKNIIHFMENIKK